MASSRVLTALAGLAISVAVSVAIYLYTGSLLVFLFVPFVPFLFRGLGGSGGHTAEERTVRKCPRCGYRTADPDYEYCPRDGRRLDTVEDARGW